MLFSLARISTLSTFDKTFAELILNYEAIAITFVYFCFIRNKPLLNFFCFVFGFVFFKQTKNVYTLLFLVVAGILKNLIDSTGHENVSRRCFIYLLIVGLAYLIVSILRKEWIITCLEMLNDFFNYYSVNPLAFGEFLFFGKAMDNGIFSGFLKELKNLN